MMIRLLVLGLGLIAGLAPAAQAQVYDAPTAFCRLRLPEGDAELGSTFEMKLYAVETGGRLHLFSDLLGECHGRLKLGSRVNGADSTAQLLGSGCSRAGLEVSIEPHDEPKRFTMWAQVPAETAKDRYLCTWIN